MGGVDKNKIVFDNTVMWFCYFRSKNMKSYELLLIRTQVGIVWGIFCEISK